MAEITKARARETFLFAVRKSVNSAVRSDGDEREKLFLLAHSILALIDGVGDMPSMDLVLRPAAGNKEGAIEDGSDYYCDGQAINDDVMLHEEWGRLFHEDF